MIKQAISQIKKRYPEVIAIYSFGSFGTAYENMDSDLDIAILCKEKIDKMELWELAQKIATTINKDVDLIDLHNASTVLSLQVITKGKLLFCGNKMECDFFEAIVLSDYADLQDRRIDIIKDIEARGRVF